VFITGTDGVELWKGHSVWFFVDAIVNVDPSRRGDAEYMLLRGMVSGPSSPKSLQAYQQVIVDDLKTWDTAQPVRD
jgi:hypothetical protein